MSVGTLCPCCQPPSWRLQPTWTRTSQTGSESGMESVCLKRIETRNYKKNFHIVNSQLIFLLKQKQSIVSKEMKFIIFSVLYLLAQHALSTNIQHDSLEMVTYSFTEWPFFPYILWWHEFEVTSQVQTNSNTYIYLGIMSHCILSPPSAQPWPEIAFRRS